MCADDECCVICVQVLLVEYDDNDNYLDAWTERLDEVWGKY